MGDWLATRATWRGVGVVPGLLHRVSYYPALTPGGGWVRGDVYELPEPPESLLVVLDAFEECRGQPEDEYRRGDVSVTLDDGHRLTA
jgi:gamma-glutamylcyclotransferase (GGCT)/AIG2-like uncharacterized protein YtfP